MINPSINDYLSLKIAPNSFEYKNIIKNSISIKQLKRLLPDSEFNELIKAKVLDTSILSCVFENPKAKNSFITYKVITTGILNVEYKKYIHKFLDDFDNIDTYDKSHLTKTSILQEIFHTDIYTFYLVDYFSN